MNYETRKPSKPGLRDNGDDGSVYNVDGGGYNVDGSGYNVDARD